MEQMRLAPYLNGEDPRSLTVARFFGMLSRIPLLKRLESGKPFSAAERADLHRLGLM
jgi:hypothetical protein